MLILYVGAVAGTSLQRANALKRLGHTVIIHDPHKAMRFGRFDRVFHYRTGYVLLQRAVRAWISGLSVQPDLVWIDHGSLIGRQAAADLRAKFRVPLVLYCIDDPTGGRDGRRFKSLIDALPLFDLCVVMRNTNVNEFKSAGAKEVMRVMMGYDEFAHFLAKENTIPSHLRSDVAFLGTWMPKENREEFLLGLIGRGVELAIWGDRWHKSIAWNKLKPYWRGPALSGRDYAMAMQGAKVCIGLLSQGNRDQHTTRSTEIPASGGLLCAQRTPEHLAMYRDGIEAVFWDDVDECATQCKRLLRDDTLRQTIRDMGRARVIELGLGNETVCQTILDRMSSLSCTT
jgi:spore maturation protein CgeB